LTRTKSEGVRSPKPLTGGYYWFPTHADGPVGWLVLTCHDLDFGPDDGHFDMWPSVVDRLATAWVQDAVRLGRRLARHCYGLPRGRVTRPDRRSLVLHGDDAPVDDWLAMVVERFDLDRRSLKILLDEHEQTFADDRRAVHAALGLPEGCSLPGGGADRC
jgi:hypothetical protein